MSDRLGTILMMASGCSSTRGSCLPHLGTAGIKTQSTADAHPICAVDCGRGSVRSAVDCGRGSVSKCS